MKESFKESLGWHLGKFVAEIIIELLGRGLFWTNKYVKNPEQTKREIKEIVTKKDEKKPIKFGFM